MPSFDANQNSVGQNSTISHFSNIDHRNPAPIQLEGSSNGSSQFPKSVTSPRTTEIYHDELSQQTFASKRQALQEFCLQTIDRNSNKYGTFPKKTQDSLPDNGSSGKSWHRVSKDFDSPGPSNMTSRRSTEQNKILHQQVAIDEETKVAEYAENNFGEKRLMDSLSVNGPANAATNQRSQSVNHGRDLTLGSSMLNSSLDQYDDYPSLPIQHCEPEVVIKNRTVETARELHLFEAKTPRVHLAGVETNDVAFFRDDHAVNGKSLAGSSFMSFDEPSGSSKEATDEWKRGHSRTIFNNEPEYREERNAVIEAFLSQRNKGLKEKREKYLRNIFYAAEEIITTEKSYNQKIKFLGSELKSKAQEDPTVAEYFKKGPHGVDVLLRIVNFFTQIETLSDGLLTEMEKSWKPPDAMKVSPALVKAAKFLQFYNDYVTNQDEIKTEFMHVVEKNAKLRHFFERFIRERLPNGSLFDIKSIMMEPVQRILRYQLLLGEYKKHQDKYYETTKDVYVDYEDTVKALKETLTAAKNANVAMFIQERQNEMDELVARASGIELRELVTPDRKLMKQERMIKADRNSYEERLFVLFSDVLMYFLVLSENSYLFKQKLDLTYMSVETHKNREDRELIIRSTDRSLTVICKDISQQTGWYEAIEKTVKEHRERLISIGQLEPGVSALGFTAPVWIRDDTVSACQIPGCDRKFTTLNRYHHCRACGKAICSNCSEVAFVPYKQKRDRVCIICFDDLEKDSGKKHEKYKKYLRQGDVYAIPGFSTSHEVSGVLEALREGTWKTSYYAVNQCVLYEYIQKNDIRAISTQPLISWRVKKLEQDVNHRPAEFCFKLEHDNMTDMIFRANSKNDRDNWVTVLRRHVMGEPLDILGAESRR